MVTTGFRRSHWVGDMGPALADQEVALAGWVQRVRDHGGLLFFDLRDRTGLVQVVSRPQDPCFPVAQSLRPETVVRVEGTVRRRSPEAINPSLPTGEVEVAASRVEVLSRPASLPFLPSEPAVEETVRLRYRYLDLRRPALQRNLFLRHRLVRAVRRTLDELGFVEVETPTLTRSTPEGARDFLVPSRLRPGSFYALPQSPQLFKQLLMVAGLERYYQIARCYRDEDLRADRQPEFTQIDLEMSFVEPSDVQAVVEAVMASVLWETVGIRLSLPLPRLTWRDAMERYGSDKPDLRYGLEAIDLTSWAQVSGVRVLAQGAAAGCAKGLVVSDQGRLRRRDLDELTALARAAGLGGMAHVRWSDGELRSSFGQGASPQDLEALAKATGLQPGQTLLLLAGPQRCVWQAVGSLRGEVARRLELVPNGTELGTPSLVWVTDFPLFEPSPEGGLDSAHHPFTAPADDALEALLEGTGDPLSWGSKAYDLVLNGHELGSGSIRIHQPQVQEAVFRLLGISPQRARERFGFLLDGLAAGAPPHGGMALGVDRLAMLLAGASSLREVIAFPKTASGTDPLTDAPAPVDPQQLAELGITLAPAAVRRG